MKFRNFIFAPICVWVAVFLGFSPKVWAQADAPTVPYLTLAAARERALEHNADLRIAETQVAAALAIRQGAREFPNPTFGLATSKINTDQRSNRTDAGNSLFDRSYDTIVSLGQLIELGGKRGLRQASSASGVQAAQAQRDDARRLLLLAVTQAYVASVAAHDTAAVRRASAASLRREAEIAGHRFTAGDISSADRAQIELAAEQLELDASHALREATNAALMLETLIGEPHPTGTVPLAADLAQLVPLEADQAQTSPTPRPDLAAATANIAKADAELSLARRYRVPDVTLSVQFERQPPDQPNTVGVGVSLPLPLWNRNGGAIAGARSARGQAAASLAKVQVQAAAEITAARVGLAESSTRARRYAQSLLPHSAEVASTLVYAYEHGGASLLEMLAAQRNHNDVRLASLLAQADWLNASAALGAALNLSAPAVSDRPTP